MMQADRIVVEARSWIGTPYVHQASVKGAGTDCLGLLRGVWRAVIGPEPMPVPAYTSDWDEAAASEVLTSAAEHCLRRKLLADAALGDVLLFRMRDDFVAKHLGIQSRIGAQAAFVHAYSRHAVVESPLSVPWARRVVARFAFPEGAG
jgi:NlpC/P60 family putative phage cell wall peptidase